MTAEGLFLGTQESRLYLGDNFCELVKKAFGYII